MAIKLMKAKKPDRPKLLIALYGPSGAGKTLLAAKLPGPILLFDAGGRFLEQARDRDDVFVAFETAKENSRIQNVTQALVETMPTDGANVDNIVVDDFTMAFQALIDEAEAMPKTGPGSREAKNHKAKVMKTFRRELFGYGKNVIVIYHTHKAGDGRSDEITERKTLSDIELGRTNMFINMTLRIEVDPQSGRRGVKVEFNRFGHSGMTIWDDTGCWEGFWEKLQAEAYKGLTWDDMHKIAAALPTTFADKPAAWSWAMEQGCFKDMAHVKNAFAKMERESEIEPEDLWTAWVAEVQRRKANATATTFASAEQAHAWGVAQGCFADLATSKTAYEAVKADKKPQKANEMFGYWIAHVNALIDEPETEEGADPGTGDNFEIEDDEPVSATRPNIPPFDWMASRLTDPMKAYAATIQAASNGTVVSPAQVASLRHAITTAAGWQDETATLDGLCKADWIANLLADRGSDPLDGYPAGAAKLIYTHLVPVVGEKKNSKYSADRAALVKEMAGMVDQAVATYVI